MTFSVSISGSVSSDQQAVHLDVLSKEIAAAVARFRAVGCSAGGSFHDGRTGLTVTF